jgi:hypothetical protein
MNLYWLYDIPNWSLFLLVEAFFVFFSVFGTFFVGKRFDKWFKLTPADNNVVSSFLSLSAIFYGVTLGLITVFTFENFNTSSDRVGAEASSLAAIYRDVGMLEKTEKHELQATLKSYALYVVNDAWKLQKKGIVPTGGTEIITKFQSQLAAYTPETEKDKIIFGIILGEFNSLVEKRRLRLNSVTTGLPMSIWVVLLLGALVNIALTWLMVIENRALDIVINALSGLLVGALIFLLIAMDNPFRGEFSVTPDAFVQLLNDVMK